MGYLKKLSEFVRYLSLLVFLPIDVADAAWITRLDLDSSNKSYTSLIYERKEQSALISFDCKDGLRVTLKISTSKKHSFKGNEYVDLVFIVDKNDPLILNAKVELINSKRVNIFSINNKVIKELITQLQMARKNIYVEAREIEGHNLFSAEVLAAGSTLAANEFIMYCKIELPIDVPHNDKNSQIISYRIMLRIPTQTDHRFRFNSDHGFRFKPTNFLPFFGIGDPG